MPEQSILSLLKRALELAMPDLRSYYRMTRKARIVASYASDGRYFADVQPLRNDESPDPDEPVIPQVEIPVMWGGPKRGIVCPPAVGTLCDLSYYDGDPNYPRISNFRWQGNFAPECGLNELIIQQTPGVSLKIEKDGSFLTVSPKNWTVTIGGNASIKAGGDASVEAGGTLTLKAPQIVEQGNKTSSGPGGGAGESTETGNRRQVGNVRIEGNLEVTGDATVGGNASAGTRSGGPCPH